MAEDKLDAGGKEAFKKLILLLPASVADEAFAIIEGMSDSELGELRSLAALWGKAGNGEEDSIAGLPESVQRILADHRARRPSA